MRRRRCCATSRPRSTRRARTRAVSLAHHPDDAAAARPALAHRRAADRPRRELIGYLYADIDGAFGRFHEADRDLLAMLASQAAVALDNAQWSQGLEQKVAQRTEELRASNAQLEQRANELAIINSIQQGMAASSTSRRSSTSSATSCARCCASTTIGIRWYDHATRTAHFLYEIEHGTRVDDAAGDGVGGALAARSPRDRSVDRPQHRGRGRGGGRRCRAPNARCRR